MTDIDEDELFINYTVRTKIVRLIDSTLLSTRLKIKAEICPDEAAEQEDLYNALAKIEVFFENVVSRCVVFDSANTAAFQMFIDETGKNRTSNVLMVTPGTPSDDLLATIFQAKMTALADGAVAFTSVEVTSDGPIGLSFTFVGAGANVLPTITEWIGERTYFAEPWWNRNDATTLDVIPPPDADLTKTPDWAISVSEVEETPAPRVSRGAFSPRVIDGGKGSDE